MMTSEDVAPFAPLALETWDSTYRKLKPRQQARISAEWMFDDEYRDYRHLGGMLLDLLGQIPSAETRRAWNEGLGLNDPRLKAFAIASLLRIGEEVDATQIELVAASLEMRMTFMRLLSGLGRESLMPEEWAEPEALAASDLCSWASHPNELDYPPEEVELIGGVRIESEDSQEDSVYLFRFREYPKPWEPGEGWMAGIAGPIRNGVSQDSPWSSFKRWDSMSPDEHFEQLYYRQSACAAR